jgi:D-glycero-alpha-D-manno-heptose 1-phosphate guanylyltransferase
MIKEAIILAGGLGTRLREAVPDLPKCMAPVAGKPFLEHVAEWFYGQGVEHIIFSLGYLHEQIEGFLSHRDWHYSIALEEEPLGTGGAIRLACSKAEGNDVLIGNGDTLFKANLSALSDLHRQQQAACSIALKPMNRFDRYGVVELDRDGHVSTFREKTYYEQGLINGGVYALNKDRFLSLPLPEKFSFEKDYLEKYCSSEKMAGFIQDAYFIDIGIPEDYARASLELASGKS